MRRVRSPHVCGDVSFVCISSPAALYQVPSGLVGLQGAENRLVDSPSDRGVVCDAVESLGLGC